MVERPLGRVEDALLATTMRLLDQLFVFEPLRLPRLLLLQSNTVCVTEW
jgi:hypothetical protein